MKRSLLAAAFCLVAFEASALERYDIDNMTCEQIQAIVAKDGLATLRYRSKRSFSLPIYDTYVHGQAEPARTRGGAAKRRAEHRPKILPRLQMRREPNFRRPLSLFSRSARKAWARCR